MPTDDHAIAAAFPAMLNPGGINDFSSLGGTSRVQERGADTDRIYRYRLLDRALSHTKFESPIFALATRTAGSVIVTEGRSRFETELTIDGDESDFFCFTFPLIGKMALARSDQLTTGTGGQVIAWRPGPATRVQISDENVRTSVFLQVPELVDALEHTLGERLRRPLVFKPDLNWNTGLAASLKRQLEFVVHEFRQPDGVANNKVALASMTDLLISLALRGIPHNYTERLDRGLGHTAPAYVLRAEDFMRSHSTEPIRLAQVAAAARCSVGTLGVAFRRFRETTPMHALRAIRLEQAKTEFARGGTASSIATIALRYGFTNSGRFKTAFRSRFGATPSEFVRRAAT